MGLGGGRVGPMTSWSRETVETMETVETVETVERAEREGGDCGDVGDSGDGGMVSCWRGDGGWRPCLGGWTGTLSSAPSSLSGNESLRSDWLLLSDVLLSADHRMQTFPSSLEPSYFGVSHFPPFLPAIDRMKS